MPAFTQLVVFGLGGLRLALPLAAVERIVRAVAVTTLPHAPRLVLGVIDVAGVVLPVLDLRRRCGLPERAIAPADQFLIARTTQRPVVLVVEQTEGVVACAAAALTPPAPIAPGLGSLPGCVRLADGLVLIHDLETFLSPAEARVLHEALPPEVPHEG